MLINIVDQELEPALARRLERLTGEDPACCAIDLRAVAERVRAEPGFDQALLAAKALSDPNRLTMAAVLAERGELCACELQAATELSHATVSHHAACLETAGLVATERRGAWVHYTLTDDARTLLAGWGL